MWLSEGLEKRGYNMKEIIYGGFLKRDERVISRTPDETIILFESKEGKVIDDTKVFKTELNEYQTTERYKSMPYAVLTIRTTTDKGVFETKWDAGWKDKPLSAVADMIRFGFAFATVPEIMKDHVRWLKEALERKKKQLGEAIE